MKNTLPHYKVKDVIFLLFEEAMQYCDELNLPYSEIVKSKKY